MKIRRKKDKKINLKTLGTIGLPIILIGGYITREIQNRMIIRKTLEVLDNREETNEKVLEIAVNMGKSLEDLNREDIYGFYLEGLE
ncbi:TPA: hypothetical protein OOH23_002547 [Enterococcus faecium]|jgi:hypothetical protein|uniref:Uncharacterized protein n=2 Tax=Peptoniphilaceae TaxID=1570339 RepID=A0A2X1XRX9_9FIRM|nr:MULTISPECIES: hypothetical protein [Peptoniphilaceae]MCI4809376.1 hypothetical protein [Clostridioides difficile]HAQ5895541.1 hypothetical protein [Enterococcus faecium]HBC4778756.1 hypothetical protein [Enterococcus faecalis]HEN9071692.1 hypothetical protein [Streptococcus agalactiae]HEQ2259347.1 hypothetical protein [Streptococcus pyogenes]